MIFHPPLQPSPPPLHLASHTSPPPTRLARSDPNPRGWLANCCPLFSVLAYRSLMHVVGIHTYSLPIHAQPLCFFSNSQCHPTRTSTNKHGVLMPRGSHSGTPVRQSRSWHSPPPTRAPPTDRRETPSPLCLSIHPLFLLHTLPLRGRVVGRSVCL
jgi:hypothetical protein